MLEFRVLGPIEILSDGERVELGKGMARVLLGALVLAAGEPLSADELIAALWGERPPATALEMIRNYVARLRARIGHALVETTPAGYRLVVEHEAIDLKRFEHLAASGARALEDGEAARASDELREALGLWRGRPLPELDDVPQYAPLLGALEEQRLRAQEDWVDAELALGRPAQLVHRLETLHEQHPYRERLLAQLMLALFRSGRQKDALDRYASGRRRLLEDVGLEPGAELQELQLQILRQDPSLRQLPPPAVPRSTAETSEIVTAVASRRRRLLPVAAAAVVAAAVVTGFAEWPRAGALSVPKRGLVAMQPTNGRLLSATPLHVKPGALAVEGPHVWIASADSATVLELSSRKTVRPRVVRVPQPAFAVSAAAGSLWIADGFVGTISRVGETDRVATFRPEPQARGRLPLVADSKGVWVASQDGTLTHLDPRTGRRIRTYDRVGQAQAIAIDRDRIWLGRATSDAVEDFDTRTGQVVKDVQVGGSPSAVAVGDGAVWVLTPLENKLLRIDPNRDAVAQSFSIPGDATALAWTPGRVWVGSADGVLLAIDTKSDTIAETRSIGRPIDALAGGAETLWASVG